MVRGGKRAGAGRPRKAPTQLVRVPVTRVSQIKAWVKDELTPRVMLPLFSTSVRAGFPSPADDHIDRYLDLNEHLIKHPAATFLVTASGDSMINAGIHSGDLMIVDRSLEATHDRIVIAALAGELTVKRLYRRNSVIKLMPENTEFEPIDITEDAEMVIWGVVTYVIHQAR